MLAQTVGKTNPTYQLSLPVSPTYVSVMGEYIEAVADTTVEAVVSTLSELLAVHNSTQWVIGDLLVYIRARAMYSETCVWGADGYPSVEFSLDNIVPSEFLFWERYDLTNGDVVLLSKNDSRYWKFLPTQERHDDDFSAYLSSIGGMLVEQLGYSNLWNYFRVAQAFPPSQRGSNSWTWYLTMTQRAAVEVGNPKDRATIDSVARQLAAHDERNGNTTVSHARAMLSAQKAAVVGWRYDIKPPKSLYINNGLLEKIMEFCDEGHAVNISRAAGVVPGGWNKLEYEWTGETLLDHKGAKVADVYMESKEAEIAVYELAKKMRWGVKKK